MANEFTPAPPAAPEQAPDASGTEGAGDPASGDSAGVVTHERACDICWQVGPENHAARTLLLTYIYQRQNREAQLEREVGELTETLLRSESVCNAELARMSEQCDSLRAQLAQSEVKSTAMFDQLRSERDHYVHEAGRIARELAQSEAGKAELNDWREWGMKLCKPPIACDADMRQQLEDAVQSRDFYLERLGVAQRKRFRANDGFDALQKLINETIEFCKDSPNSPARVVEQRLVAAVTAMAKKDEEPAAPEPARSAHVTGLHEDCLCPQCRRLRRERFGEEETNALEDAIREKAAAIFGNVNAEPAKPAPIHCVSCGGSGRANAHGDCLACDGTGRTVTVSMPAKPAGEATVQPKEIASSRASFRCDADIEADMAKTDCSVAGCGDFARTYGLCFAHARAAVRDAERAYPEPTPEPSASEKVITVGDVVSEPSSWLKSADQHLRSVRPDEPGRDDAVDNALWCLLGYLRVLEVRLEQEGSK